MKFTVETLSHPPLAFSSTLPDQFTGMRLGGATVNAASGAFGNLCLQEFDGGEFIIRYTVIVTKTPFVIRVKNKFQGLHAVILQQGEADMKIKDAATIVLHEGQFTMLHASETEVEVKIAADQRISFFELLLNDIWALELAAAFENLYLPFSKCLPEVWVNPALYIDAEVKDNVRYILHYHDDPAWRKNYYENKAWDTGWKLLALRGGTEIYNNEFTEEEQQKVRAVQKMIVDNLKEHLVVRELAKKVGTSESKLKKIFTSVYGMGIHEYRIQERLKLAVELIEKGKLVKEAAAMTGWRPADLIKAYYKIYRTTPGTIKGKKR